MKNLTKRLAATAALALVGALALSGCTGNTSERQAYEDRKSLAAEYDTTSSLELTNLKEKRAREDDPEALRYLYVMSFGDIVGYYVTKGKISSNGSQIAPETEFVRPSYANGTSADFFSVESAQDDGSYGDGDPGIFFFTSDGTMVVTSLDYIQSDAPLAIDVPRLGG
jgi:hypothetical protein